MFVCVCVCVCVCVRACACVHVCVCLHWYVLFCYIYNYVLTTIIDIHCILIPFTMYLCYIIMSLFGTNNVSNDEYIDFFKCTLIVMISKLYVTIII